MKPTTVDNGATALDALIHAAANSSRYDLVLLDSQMPDIDGLHIPARSAGCLSCSSLASFC